MAKFNIYITLAVVVLAVVHLGVAKVIIPVEDLFEDEKATWSDFQQRHILEPTGENSGYTGWSNTQWNAFLKTRISNYGSKSVNSFIVTTPEAVTSTIASSTAQHSAATNLFWSSRTFSIYVMSLSGSTYNTYNCGRLYFLAGVDNNTNKVPVHYQAQSDSRPSSGSLPLNLDACTRVN